MSLFISIIGCGRKRLFQGAHCGHTSRCKRSRRSTEFRRSVRCWPQANSATAMMRLFNLIEVGAIPFRSHIVAMDEAQRGGVDAIAQPSLIRRSIFEHVAEVAVAGG